MAATPTGAELFCDATNSGRDEVTLQCSEESPLTVYYK